MQESNIDAIRVRLFYAIKLISMSSNLQNIKNSIQLIIQRYLTQLIHKSTRLQM